MKLDFDTLEQQTSWLFAEQTLTRMRMGFELLNYKDNGVYVRLILGRNLGEQESARIWVSHFNKQARRDHSVCICREDFDVLKSVFAEPTTVES